MREDIYTEENGVRKISLRKVFGTGYDDALYTRCKARYRLFKGARSTKKSTDIDGYEVILKILSDDRRNILICRQNDVDNRQTTFANILGCIDDLGISIGNRMTDNASFIASVNPLEITYKPTGQKIIFRGLNNPTSLNGLKFIHGFLTDVYIDEAFEIPTYEDFRKLDGTLRGKLPDGLFLQITLTFNAWSKESWIYPAFFQENLEDDYAKLDDPDTTYMDFYDPEWIGPYGKGLYLHTSTYKINEFRDKETYDASMRMLRDKANEIYRTEGLGMWGNSTETVYLHFNDSLIVPSNKIIGTDDRGMPLMDFADFTIGIDTGLSNGEGRKRVVLKNQDPSQRVKAATVMELFAVTEDYSKMVTIDEYFHSRDKSNNISNTDNRDDLTTPQLADKCIDTIIKWMNMYGQSKTILMKGNFNVYIDCEDIGFRDVLQMKAEEKGLYYAKFYGSTKTSIQSRVDFESLMMAFGDFIVCDQCKNLIRELKNCRRGDKGEARADGDDHAINAMEYGAAPLLPSLKRYKTFKQR